MRSTHLDGAAAALADGQLTGAPLDRALGHVAVCALCRAEVEQHRALKTRVAGLASPAPPVDLTARLLALSPGGGSARPGLAGPAPWLVDPTPVPLARPASAAFAVSSSSPTADPSAVRARWASPRSLAISLLALSVLGAGVVLANGNRAAPADRDGRVVDPAAFSVVQHERSTQGVVLPDPAFLVVATVGDR